MIERASNFQLNGASVYEVKYTTELGKLNLRRDLKGCCCCYELDPGIQKPRNHHHLRWATFSSAIVDEIGGIGTVTLLLMIGHG